MLKSGKFLKNKKKRKKIDWEREKIMGDINGLTCAKKISKRFELLDEIYVLNGYI